MRGCKKRTTSDTTASAKPIVENRSADGASRAREARLDRPCLDANQDLADRLHTTPCRGGLQPVRRQLSKLLPAPGQCDCTPECDIHRQHPSVVQLQSEETNTSIACFFDPQNRESGRMNQTHRATSLYAYVLSPRTECRCGTTRSSVSCRGETTQKLLPPNRTGWHSTCGTKQLWPCLARARGLTAILRWQST